LRAAFPDLQLTVEDIIAEGDRVAVNLTARGTHRGTFQGIAPTGKTVTVSAFEVVRIENGKLVEHWGGPDTLNLLQQLGAVISAGK
jgi:predicted ester cyclase